MQYGSLCFNRDVSSFVFKEKQSSAVCSLIQKSRVNGELQCVNSGMRGEYEIVEEGYVKNVPLPEYPFDPGGIFALVGETSMRLCVSSS